jgi:hypothetical protein
MPPSPSIRLLAPIAAVLRDLAAHGLADLPPILRYRVCFQGNQRQAHLFGGQFFAETRKRKDALDQNTTARILGMSVTSPDGRNTTIGGLFHEAAEAHPDHRHPEWCASEGTYGQIDFYFVPRRRITGTITHRKTTLLTSRL